MKFPLKSVVASLALIAAAPVSADLVEVGAGCDASLPDPNAIDCAGAYAGNLNSESREADLNAALDALMGGYPDIEFGDVEDTKLFFEADGQILEFDEELFGLQIFSIHFGDAGSGIGDHTILYLFDFGMTGASSVDLNQNGWSNTVLVTPPGVVPEPATWAMMLMGFGAAGYAIRRRRRSASLPQLA